MYAEMFSVYEEWYLSWTGNILSLVPLSVNFYDPDLHTYKPSSQTFASSVPSLASFAHICHQCLPLLIEIKSNEANESQTLIMLQ